MSDEVKHSTAMSSSPVPHFGETHGEKLSRKAKEAPFIPIGIAGLLGVVGYGVYKFKSRGGMSTSVYLMQLRVAAQGTVVACLTAGLVYSMAKEYLFKSDDQKKQ